MWLLLLNEIITFIICSVSAKSKECKALGDLALSIDCLGQIVTAYAALYFYD